MAEASEDLVEEYRSTMARLASGISVIALRYGTADLAITANSLVSASLRPPILLFCVHRDSRMCEALEEVDTWAVSLLDARAGAAAERLAGPGRPSIGQLLGIDYERGQHSGAALLSQAQGWLEARTVWRKPAGEHEVVVGDVVHAQQRSTTTGALIHHLGRIRGLSG